MERQTSFFMEGYSRLSRLDPPADQVERLGRLLTPDEWQRANRFRFDMPQYIEWYLAGKLKLDELIYAAKNARNELISIEHLTEEQLDQCWDLLRQRRALREAGLDPESAHARGPEVVERYEQ